MMADDKAGVSSEGLGPLPAGLLTVDSPPGIAHAGGMRRYEPIQALPDGEHLLYTLAALDAAVAADCERIKAALIGMDDAVAGRHNYYAHAAWVLFERA